jgi:hypothetical protein
MASTEPPRDANVAAGSWQEATAVAAVTTTATTAPTVLPVPTPAGGDRVAVVLVLYGPPWDHYLGGYQDRELGGPLGLPDLRCMTPDGVKHKDCRGEVLG